MAVQVLDVGEVVRPLPPLDEVIDSGKVLCLNMPAGTNSAPSRAVGVLLKQAWLQTLLRRLAEMHRDPDRVFRPAVFLCDEYQTFATVGEDDPAGDEKAFALTRQSRLIPIVATQSISSLRAVLGQSEAWRALLQTLRTRIFLSLADDSSVQIASVLCGQVEKMKVSYSVSEQTNRATASLLSGSPGGGAGSLSASKSFSERREALFHPPDFALLRNCQAIVLPYDGQRAHDARRCYLKPDILPRDRPYWRARNLRHSPLGQTSLQQNLDFEPLDCIVHLGTPRLWRPFARAPAVGNTGQRLETQPITVCHTFRNRHLSAGERCNWCSGPLLIEVNGDPDAAVERGEDLHQSVQREPPEARVPNAGEIRRGKAGSDRGLADRELALIQDGDDSGGDDCLGLFQICLSVAQIAEYVPAPFDELEVVFVHGSSSLFSRRNRIRTRSISARGLLIPRFRLLLERVNHPQASHHLRDIDDPPSVRTVTHRDLHHAGAQALQRFGDIGLAALRGNRKGRADSVADRSGEPVVRLPRPANPPDRAGDPAHAECWQICLHSVNRECDPFG